MSRKKYAIIAAAVLILIAIVGGGYYYWWIGTPQYSIQRVNEALKEKNIDTALSYFDSDAIFASLWDKTQTIIAEGIIDNPDAAGGMSLAIPYIEQLKPSYRAKLDKSIKETLSSATSSPIRDLLEHPTNLKIDGKVAYIGSGSFLLIKLKQQDNRLWKVVGFDGSWSSSDATSTDE